MVFLTTFYKYIIQQYFTVTVPHCVAGDNTKFINFNTHCCPKIRLCGWHSANHFTLVIGCRGFGCEDNL